MKVNSPLIKELRQSKGWTQQHLADVLGLSLRTVQRIEKTGTTSLDTISALSCVFEVERNQLSEEEPSQSSNSLLGPPAFLAIAFACGLLLGGFLVYLLLNTQS